MKLLIELPDEQFDNIKNSTKDFGVMINSMRYAIKHGTPLNEVEAEDCISREEISKHIESGLSSGKYGNDSCLFEKGNGL